MKILKNIFAVSILWTAVTTSSCQNQKVSGGIVNLNAVEFDKKITELNASQIVDVRTPEEYAGGFIKNAMNNDWNNASAFEKNISALDKNKPVFVYCLAGGRSSAAVNKMAEMGFKEVYQLTGGTKAWEAAGFKLEGATRADLPGISLDDFNKKITSEKIVLVDFYAPWCIPCRKMMPMFDSLSTEMKETLMLVKINTEENKPLSKQLSITTVPMLVIYKNAKPVWKHEGIISKEELLKAIKSIN